MVHVLQVVHGIVHCMHRDTVAGRMLMQRCSQREGADSEEMSDTLNIIQFILTAIRFMMTSV